MLPAYIDPIAPGIVEAWQGVFAGVLAWLVVAALLGTLAVVILVASQTMATRRRRGTREREPSLQLHDIRRAEVRP